MTVQRFYRVHRFLGQLCRKLSAFLQTEQRRKRGFLACRILADGFSECCGISLDIEDIVLNLERQTQLFAVSACPSEGVLVGRTGRRTAEFTRGAEQAPGLQLLQQAQLVERDFAMLGAHIEHLTADHAVHARVFAQNTNTAHDGLRRNILCRRSRLKSRRQQSVTREDRRCFIESLVAGRSAAAQVVVIHARKVIMDE